MTTPSSKAKDDVCPGNAGRYLEYALSASTPPSDDPGGDHMPPATGPAR